jgi:hypothetical protein
MQPDRKRQWYAWLLLGIFLPMFLAASMHVHEPVGSAGVECYYCVHHIHHDGHLAKSAICNGECVLCHFLSLPYLIASGVVLKLALFFLHRQMFLSASRTCVLPAGVVSLRAPPVLH